MELSTLIILFAFLTLSSPVFCFELITYGGIALFGSLVYKTIDSGILCKFSECCSSGKNFGDGMNFEEGFSGLIHSLETKVHGQHLVRKVLVQSLRAHYSNPNPSKALVLSFHGWTGGGKNFVARQIIENIYKLGMDSKFVHLFVSTVNFPHEDEADIYKLQIQDWIRGNVSLCEHSIFIFDEIDKMPVGMIDGIKPFIDYHQKIFGINFRKSIFLFLSNTGSREIITKMLAYWKDGKQRTEVTYEMMEDLVQKGAFNEKGGLHQSDLIQSSLIDFYIPFLPLERRHVELCIKDELRRRGMHQKSNSDVLTRKILEKMIFFPPENRLYSTKGCKSVATKVGYLLAEEHFDSLLKNEL